MAVAPMRMKLGIPPIQLRDPREMDLENLLKALDKLEDNTKIMFVREVNGIEEHCWKDVKNMILEDTDKIEPFALDTNSFSFMLGNEPIFVGIVRNAKCFTSKGLNERNPFSRSYNFSFPKRLISNDTSTAFRVPSATNVRSPSLSVFDTSVVHDDSPSIPPPPPTPSLTLPPPPPSLRTGIGGRKTKRMKHATKSNKNKKSNKSKKHYRKSSYKKRK